MDAKEHIAQCCWHLQQSHFNIAKKDLALAKKHCQLASLAINEALQNKTNFLAPTIASVAQFTIKFYKQLLEKGLASLLAQEKLQWLASTNCDRDWFPILRFGEVESTALAPVELIDDNTLLLPKLSSDFAVEFNETVARLSIERQLSALKFDPPHKLKKGTLALSDLYQDLLTNCSFVLSLLSIAELGMELDLRSLVTFHGNSRAKVELFFNGTRREISITTCLPFVLPPHESRSLHVRSLSSEALTWPAILEKAFLIALGEDYTFSGSNMAQDTYALIGWIPEIRKTGDCSFEEIAEFWRLKDKGIVALGLGTGPMSAKLAAQLEVVPEHDYVLSNFDAAAKTLILRNPWTAETLTDMSMQQHLRVDVSLFGQFSYLYVNWNPLSFKTSRVTFSCVALEWPEMYLADKPQYAISNATQDPQETIVLVERYSRLDADICLSVWEGTKDLIYTTTEYPLVDGGIFSKLRLTSLRFTMQPNTDYIISVSSHNKKSSICSLAVFHKMDNIKLTKAKARLPKNVLPITGKWYGPSRGGSWTRESYINNPQYDFKIDRISSVAIILAAKDPNNEVAVHLFHREEQYTKKLKCFDRLKLLANEKYSRCICFLSVENLDPGSYRLVVSALECKDNDEYLLVLAHDAPDEIHLERVPQALGTFEQKKTFDWGGRNRSKVLLRSKYSRTVLTVHVLAGIPQLSIGAYIPAVRASLFDFETSEPIIVTSEWNDSLYGVFLECELPEGERSYILLIERFEPGEGVCRLEIGSSSRLIIEQIPL